MSTACTSGPVIDAAGLRVIGGYVGKDPGQRTYAEAVAFRKRNWVAFRSVPDARWRAEVEAHYEETPEGLRIRYDPALREAVLESAGQPAPDLWPLFDALEGLPICLIRGANSDLLSAETAAEMARRRPDMGYAEVPDRGHVPFLDEPESLEVLTAWISKLPR